MSTRMGWTRVIVTMICCCGTLSVSLRAEETASQDMPDHRLVVRISDQFLNSLLENEQIDRQMPVRENILGTDVQGQSRIQAQPGVRLIESPDKASFYLTLNGTVHSRSTGYHGPAIIHSRAVTTFTAAKKIVFEPGKGFRGMTPVVHAKTTTYVDGISSVPGGIVGRIVRRRASRQEASQHNLAQEIARQRAEARIRAGFQRTSEERLAKLNQSPQLTALASLLKASGNGDLQYACCTTRDCLQVASFFANDQQRGPIQLPFAESTPHAPIEVWMHESIVTPSVEAGMEVVKTVANTATPTVNRTGERLVTIHHVDDWRQVNVDAKPAQLMALASLLPDATQLRAKPVLPGVVNRVVNGVTNGSPNGTTNGATNNERQMTKVGPRTWRSGKYSAEATFVALEGKIVRLQRTTGVDTSIDFEKLSAVDQDWIRRHLAYQ